MMLIGGAAQPAFIHEMIGNQGIIQHSYLIKVKPSGRYIPKTHKFNVGIRIQIARIMTSNPDATHSIDTT